jgi:hypothetical protein
MDNLGGMTLTEWIALNKTTVTRFAAQIPCRRSHLLRYINAERLPGKARIARIHHLTNGQVSANDWHGLPKICDCPKHPTETQQTDKTIAGGA